jgi:hypothetical protein
MLNGSEKIKKILPQLTQDNDVAIVAAINAIKRILASEGKSFHDVELVAKGGSSGGNGYQYQSYGRSQRQEKPRQERTYEHSGEKAFTFEKQKEMAEFIDQNTPSMTEWETTFWQDIQGRIYRMKLSAKQMAIIERLYDRAILEALRT